MATYVNDLRLTELATGEGSGTWGTTTNTNLELIGEALGFGTQDCFTTDADATTTVADGATDPARAMYFKVTSSATLTATRTLTIGPNTVSRVMWIENATTGSQSIAISQGSGANVTIATGKAAVVYLDGAGATAAVVDAMNLVDPGVTDTLAEVLVAGNATGGTDIAVGTGDDITFANNSKAIFGGSTELQIYYEAGASVNLIESPTYNIQVGANAIDFTSYAGTAYATIDSSGIDVTGTVTADGLTVDGNAAIAGSQPRLALEESDTTDLDVYLRLNGGDFTIETRTDAGVKVGDRIRAASNGDISFYEDTGTTVKFFWDASAESLGVGTTSPVGGVHSQTASAGVNANSNFRQFVAENSGNAGITILSGASSLGTLVFGDSGSSTAGRVQYDHSNDSLAFSSNNSEAMRIDSSGNVGIGTSSPASRLELSGEKNTSELRLSSTTNNSSWVVGDYYGKLSFYSGDGSGGGAGVKASVSLINALGVTGSTSALVFSAPSTTANDVERMRIDSAGNVGIGVVPATDWSTSYHALQVGSTATFMGAASGSGEGNWISNNAIFSTSGSWEYLQTASASSLDMQSSTAPFRFRYAASGTAGAAISWSEAMRIDSSGNLLVGTTTANPTSAAVNTPGVELSATGGVRSTVTSDPAATFNRKTDDGPIVLFRKDGTTVGNIGVADSGDRIYFSGAGEGLAIDNSANAIFSCNSSGAGVDASVDLGFPSLRWKNLYLSGGVYLGGTGAANKLDDYEEGTWTPTIEGSTGDPSYTASSAAGNYTKIGRVVYVEFRIIITGVSSQGAGNVNITGLPFTSGSTIYSNNISFTYNDVWDNNIRDGYTTSTHIQPVPNAITQSNVSFSGYTLSTGYFSGAGWYIV